jgi:RHS repeat-associated protein
MTEATPYREPYVFSFRRPGRSFLARLVAHLVIRLLIIAPLPGPWQAAAALFPASMLWPLVQAAPAAGEAETPHEEIVWPDNLLKEITLPSGVKATHSYDKADRLTMLLNANGASVLSSYAYPLYDGNGNRLTQVEKNGGTTETTAYEYDDLNRLETITYPSDTTNYPNGRKVTYGYDPVGNRTLETETNTAGTVLSNKVGAFDDLNRLTKLTDLAKPESDPTRVTDFTWDRNGNQTEKIVGPGPGAVTTTYHYDVRDKLVEVGQGASILGRFQYDFEGRRNVKIGEFGTEQYVYDGTSTFLEYDQDGTLKAKYDYGSDRLIGVSRLAGSLFERRYYSFDALRSVTNLSDTTGAVKASYHLDAWGNFRFPQELNADGDTVAAKNRFAFTGYLWDKETNLFFAKARFYDPEVGRFISQDSYLGQVDDPPSLHRYFYANDNPTRYVDPTGHDPEEPDERVPTPEPAPPPPTPPTTNAESPASDGDNEIGSSGVRLHADKPRAEYKNPVARQHAANGQLKLADRAEANHGCAYCHTVKEYRTLAEADAAIDPEHYNRVAVTAKAGVAVGELVVVLTGARAALTPVPEGTAPRTDPPPSQSKATIQQPTTAKPVPAGEAASGEVQMVKPSELRWTQRTAGGRGRADGLRQSMAERGYAGDPIDVVKTTDGLVTVDHTRPAVALEQGIERIPARVHAPADPLPAEMAGRFGKAKTWGDAAAYRGASQDPPLPPTGTTTPPRLPRPRKGNE